MGYETEQRPYPAKKSLPKWYKDLPSYDVNPDGKRELYLVDGVSNVTAKKCMPMLDSMMAGYIIPLHSDVQVINDKETPEISWRSINPVFEIHGTSAEGVETPPGYHKRPFKFLSSWIPQTPKGYSVLITSPLGYHDPVFKAIPAIVDTDKGINELLPPVWVKNDFNGVVEQGTPMIQIIPFKRDNWEAEFDYFKTKEEWDIYIQKTFFSRITNNYIRNTWSKKHFD